MRPAAFVIPIALSCAPLPESPEGAEPVPAYDRGDWGGWRDDDGDCRDTRQEVLVTESEVEVTFEDGRECRVATGRWTDAYTGEVLTDPGALDVDHMVPLREAHDSGAWRWDEARRRDYFNSLADPDHLRAVSASANRSKGSRSPEEWMPPDGTRRCRYAKDWLRIKDAWGLEVPPSEALFLARTMSALCGD